MSILTKEEREQGMEELKSMVDIETLTEEDLRYFRKRLIQGLEIGASTQTLERDWKQLALMEDAMSAYNEGKSKQ